MKVNWYELGSVEHDTLKYVVIVAKQNENYLFVRHKERVTFEIPGGHIEKNEWVDEAAKRELYEETGAISFDLIPVGIYSVVKEDEESFGQLFYAEVKELGELPPSEIAEMIFLKDLPLDLTYPMIQPVLFDKVRSFKR